MPESTTDGVASIATAPDREILNLPGLQPDMKRLFPPCLILAVFLPAPARPGDSTECFRLICHDGGNASDHCTAPSSNLSAKMPRGFSITSVNGNAAISAHSETGFQSCAQTPALRRPISLDSGSLYGGMAVSGTLRATGVLRYEPNDGGELEFRPDAEAFAGTGPFFRAHFNRLKLDSAQPSPVVVPPPALRNADCWQAKASIVATDFRVLVGDTSAAGVYVDKLRLDDIREFTACQWGGP